MNIVAIGDIVGRCGRDALSFWLPEFIEENQIDFVIANGENVAHGKGINEAYANLLFDSGVDVITMGNHTFGNKEVFSLLQFEDRIVRPNNLPQETPGRGFHRYQKNGMTIGVINVLGRVYMEPLDCPFVAAKNAVIDLQKDCDLIFVDMHAEATSEKIALGWFLDGMVTAVFGTHTHVQTADERISNKGTAYISDLGMTGAMYSVLGMERQIVIDRFVKKLPSKFQLADGAAQINGALFSVDDETKTVKSISRIFIKK